MGNTRDTGYLRNIIAYDASGNVGIGGAVNGSYKLAVTGAATISGNVGIGGGANERLTITGPSGLSGMVRWTDATTGSAFLGFTSGGVAYIHSNNNSLAFGANGSNNFAETMRITSGNVGIGTTSPNSILDVRAASGTTGSILNLSNTSSAASGNIAPIRFYSGNTFGGLEQVAAIWASNPNAGANNGGQLFFGLSAYGTATTPTERMNINVGGVMLTYDGQDQFMIRNASDNNRQLLIGYVYSGNYARIQAVHQGVAYRNIVLNSDGGNVLIGTTTDNGYKLNVNGAISAPFTRYTGNSDFYIGVGSAISGAFGGNDFVIWNSANAGGTLILNGSPIAGVVLPKGATSWSSYSDIRLKTDIENIDSAIDKLSGLRTIKYHLKNIDSSDSKKRYGLVAQDLVGKFDEVLELTKNYEDGMDYYGVKYTELIPVLVKAAQEEDAKVEDLKAEVAQLKEKIAYLENK